MMNDFLIFYAPILVVIYINCRSIYSCNEYEVSVVELLVKDFLRDDCAN